MISNKVNQKKSFFRLMTGRIEYFTWKGKYKTAGNYRCALKQFIAFRQGEDLSIGSLSVSLLRDFQDYLVQKHLKMNTVSLYMRMLRAGYNYAVDEEWVREGKRPFRKVFTGREKTRKRALSQRTVRLLMSVRLDDASLEFARDLFLFSIYMQGMPFVDIAHLRKSQLCHGYIVYQRRKTNRSLKVRVEKYALAIINKYKVNDVGCPYLFPILVKRGTTKVCYDSALRIYNKRLERLSVLLWLDDPLTSYTMKHHTISI